MCIRRLTSYISLNVIRICAFCSMFYVLVLDLLRFSLFFVFLSLQFNFLWLYGSHVLRNVIMISVSHQLYFTLVSHSLSVCFFFFSFLFCSNQSRWYCTYVVHAQIFMAKIIFHKLKLINYIWGIIIISIYNISNWFLYLLLFAHNPRAPPPSS